MNAERVNHYNRLNALKLTKSMARLFVLTASTLSYERSVELYECLNNVMGMVKTVADPE